MVCDLDIEWDIPHDDITFLGIKNAYAIALPLAGGGEGRFRVTMGMPLTEEEKKIITNTLSQFAVVDLVKKSAWLSLKSFIPPPKLNLHLLNRSSGSKFIVEWQQPLQKAIAF